MNLTRIFLAAWALLICSLVNRTVAENVDLILHDGKIVTVDDKFSVAEAIAIRKNRIVKVGANVDVLKLRSEATRMVDLQGKTVIPGLMDSHTHAGSAAVHEWRGKVPQMDTIEDVLNYIETRTKEVEQGEWIALSQVFITRLRERRYPTREELDRVAPNHPVIFSTGPDAAVNSLALKLSGIDKNFKVTGRGYLERDPETGELTGILRSCKQIIKYKSSGKQITEDQRTALLVQLFEDYNSVGLTSVVDRGATDSALNRYEKIYRQGDLTLRMSCSYRLGIGGSMDSIRQKIDQLSKHHLRKGNPYLRLLGVKTWLDGGMLTGSAYMRKPWGVSKIYSITDPRYRGLRYIEQDRLVDLIQATVDAGMQYTAHSVGDGAVHALLDAYEEVNKKTPIQSIRPCITHSNFMSREAVEKMVKLGVVADIQPAWLYLDAQTLTAQFGYDRLRYFQPLKTIFEQGVIAGGGSDHMQKIGSLRSVNPYNPFLGMWVTITRKPRGSESSFHAEEALTREQALRFYTINNAYLIFREKELGSLEAGKLADLVVLDRDILTCPVDEIREIQPLQTYVDGKVVFEKK